MEETIGERMSRSARNFAEEAGARTGRLARIARLQLDLLGIQRERARVMRDLGQRTYELLRSGGGGRIELDAAVEGIVQQVARLDGERGDREREIAELRAGGRPAPKEGF